MCLFCAAIPTVAALGAAAHGKRREAERAAERQGRSLPKRKAPIAKATTALVVALVIASAVYHTQQPA
jgi:uncharacterized membrane protein YidH (DUF202 family)